ncbi:MAG TPA: carboxypeptidase-like regulatory domain-containing protein, partial [Saprospiraceae bacterium]|nr:carboxypeptidase-like regulatory domain-containing protein [Saprospiraceae bacterium]
MLFAFPLLSCRNFLWCALCCCATLPALAQSPLTQAVDFDCASCTPAEALVALSRQTGVNIVFSDHFFETCPHARWHAQREPLQRLVERISACGNRPFALLDGQIVFSPEKKKYTLSGYVQDEATGERLLGTSIGSLTERGKGCVTNEFGFFSLRLEAGEHRLALARVGYQPSMREVELSADRVLVLKMQPNTTLPEVLIRPTQLRDSSRRDAESISPVLLEISDLKFMPAPGGEPDLMRQVALEPGVQTGVDGLGGLHVRGGNADQNLILLDDVPV